jgi:hypothetical protein
MLIYQQPEFAQLLKLSATIITIVDFQPKLHKTEDVSTTH